MDLTLDVLTVAPAVPTTLWIDPELVLQVVAALVDIGDLDGIADLRLAHVLHARDQVAHLTDREPLGRRRPRR